MVVEVLLFGPERAAAGADRVSVRLEGARTCRDLRAGLREAVPGLRASLGSARFAVNSKFAHDDMVIGPSDEVALIGLVSGG